MRQQPATQDRQKLLSAAEAAERLGVEPETVRRLVRSGELEAHKTGAARNSHLRISEQAIVDYLERHKVVPAKEAS
jgi:excisionase family DNA binding protein